MDDRERALAEAADELAETLEALREELTEPRRGPFGVPRPPRPAELLRFTEQYTIPALISLFEASIRTLELLAAGIRLVDGRPVSTDDDRDRVVAAFEAAGREGGDRLAAASQTTLRRLDDALAELQAAAAGGDPGDEEIRELLSEARSLRAEVSDQLAAATDASDISSPDSKGGTTDAGTDTSDDAAGTDVSSSEVGIDVDEELASIKRTVDGDDDGDTDADATDNNE